VGDSAQRDALLVVELVAPAEAAPVLGVGRARREDAGRSVRVSPMELLRGTRQRIRSREDELEDAKRKRFPYRMCRTMHSTECKDGSACWDLSGTAAHSQAQHGTDLPAIHGADLALAERVIQGVIDGGRGDASREAVTRSITRYTASRPIADQWRRLPVAATVSDARRNVGPVVELIGIRIFQCILVLRTADRSSTVMFCTGSMNNWIP